MKDTKYILVDTTIYDYALIEEKLTKLASEGWHLQKTGPLGWKLRRGEPKQVRYAVTYAPSASAFNSRPTEAEEDLADLCAQAGWVRVANQAQVHIYRNEDPNATPLETDEAQRLRNIRRTMRKHFFPTEALMVGVFLMQFFMHFHTLTQYLGRTLSSPLMVSTLVMCLFVAVIHAALALDGFLWLHRAQKAVDGGGPIPVNRFYRRFRWVIWAFLGLYLLCLLWSAGLNMVAAILGISILSLAIIVGGISLFKSLNAPRWVNMLVPAGLCALVMMGMLTLFVISMDRSSRNEELPPAQSLPVTLTQLTGETDTERFILEESSSPLSSYGRYWDTGADGTRLSYTIVDVKCPLFYDILQKEQEELFLGAVNHLADREAAEYAALFNADYVRHSYHLTYDRWLICWDSRIVNLRASWELTREQIAALAEILKPQ